MIVPPTFHLLADQLLRQTRKRVGVTTDVWSDEDTRSRPQRVGLGQRLRLGDIKREIKAPRVPKDCLLYTSDAADE